MKTIQLLLLCTISLQLFAAKTNYDVDLIPDHLKKDAQLVIRHRSNDFTIHSDHRSTLKVHYAITILNEAATDQSSFKVYYNKFSNVSNIKGTVYDAKGKKVKSLKFYLEDQSAISYTTLYSDTRVKRIKSPYLQVPFTVEYSYEISTNGTLDYPDFYTVDYGTALEIAEHTVTVPQDKSIKFHNQNIDIKPTITQKGETTYYWKVENLKAIKYEPATKPKGNIIPMVNISPMQFKMEGYAGSNQSWKDFGQWIYSLNLNKSDLSEATKQELKSLVAHSHSTTEKIKILYKYMQNRTRYANIQIGIGGWQPFPASVVHEQGYGDCKALTNYMQALLEAVEIPSYYTLVNAGQSATLINVQEPSNQFNHALLCVPLEGQDTLWLECTSQTHPFAYVSTFSDDRYALLIKQDGGQLVRTKRHTAHENVDYTNTEVAFDENLKAKVSFDTYKQGLFFDRNQHLLFKDAVDERRAIINSLTIKDFDLKDYTINTYLDSLPYIKLSAELDLNNYCTPMNKTVFFKLNMLNRFDDIPGYTYNRNNALFIRRAYSVCDKMSYQIPSNYHIKSLPESRQITTKFGQYKLNVHAKDNMIYVDRILEINKGTFPKSEYVNYIEFLEKVAKNEECIAEIESL